MNVFLILVAIIFGMSVFAFIASNYETYATLAIISGVILGVIVIISANLHSHTCKYKSNVIHRYEQLTREKTTIDTNGIVKLGNDDVFKIIEVNNEYTAKLTFHDTMRMKRFFDYKHKCCVKECVSNYRKCIQNYLNQYAVKRLEIAFPSGTYTTISTNPIKLSEISMR